MRRLLSSVALGSALVGCVSSSPPERTADVVVPPPPADSSPAHPGTAASAPAPVEHKPTFVLPRVSAADAIGAGCQPGTPSAAPGTVGPLSHVETCGRNGRRSIEIAPATVLLATPDGGPSLPCKPAPIGEMQINDVSACVVGDELLLTSLCTVCRMMGAGSVIHAELSALTPEQASTLWHGLQMKDEPPRDAAGWSSAVSAASRKPAPQP